MLMENQERRIMSPEMIEFFDKFYQLKSALEAHVAFDAVIAKTSNDLVDNTHQFLFDNIHIYMDNILISQSS